MAAAHELNGPGFGVTAMMTDKNVRDWADRIGEHGSTVVIAFLIALCAYGYLGWLVFG